MTLPGEDHPGDKEEIIRQRKRQVWLITLAMVFGGCLLTSALLGLIWVLFKKILPIL